jgi:hypothetical protein
MGLLNIQENKNKIKNPLEDLNIESLQETYNTIVLEQANQIFQIFDIKLKKKNLYKFFRFFDKNYIIVELPIKIFKENMQELRSKGFVPEIIEENEKDTKFYSYDENTKLYTYKFQWTNDKFGGYGLTKFLS